jgi:hypothetical protein
MPPRAGFSFRGAVHAYSVMDAYVYGFALRVGLDLILDGLERLQLVPEPNT